MAKNPFIEVLQTELPEREIPTSFYLRESIAVSLSTVCERMQVKKKDIVNQLLDVALEQYIDAIYETRPDLQVENPNTGKADGRAWSILKPSMVREAKQKFKTLEFDFEDEKEEAV